ncbi:unnamed protein product [Spirodela intermedia]|uniref:Uncharacterized protein n=1 Tax=Spirodela intermedia TaxID=51605 RepID=A0A7I8KSJ6_SPIIN|nr:unnamed protein product [Spirodela intermedia]
MDLAAKDLILLTCWFWMKDGILYAKG